MKKHPEDHKDPWWLDRSVEQRQLSRQGANSRKLREKTGIGFCLGLAGLCGIALTFTVSWMGRWTFGPDHVALQFWLLTLFVLSPAALLVGVPLSLWEIRRRRVSAWMGVAAVGLCLLNPTFWVLFFWFAAHQP